MTFKKSSVVMLPTNQRAAIFKGVGDELFINPKYDKDGIYQHLYLLSDEKIEVGDWVYNAVDKKIVQILEDIRCVCKTDKKIIATTDKLPTEPYQGHFEGIDCTNYLPQPSESFIKKFVSEYNKGNVITEVLVEYWRELDQRHSDNPDYVSNVLDASIRIKEVLKVSKDNTITIKKVKDCWSIEEISELFNKFRKDFPLHRGIQITDYELNKWIEKNL